MNFTESISIGIKELSAHKLRSLLTMLGVIFGVAAVVSMVSIGAGAREEALNQIKLLGTNNIWITVKSLSGLEYNEALKKSPRGLTTDDTMSIKQTVSNVSSVSAVKIVDGRVVYQNEDASARITCTTPEMKTISDIELGEGRFLNKEDIEENRRVCVIGSEVKEKFFPIESSINKQIKIKEMWFTVVGDMKAKPTGTGASDPLGMGNFNVYVFIPLNSAYFRFGADRKYQKLDAIAMKLRDTETIQESANLIKKILLRRHNDVEDFKIIVPEELIKQSQRTQKIFNIVMSAIAGISLIVGGIGIMNIMLATVTQRTREIGIRRAIGATRIDILRQFLIESLVISLLGGLIGILLGYGFAKVITYYAGWNTIVSVKSILVSFLVSAMTGLIFGLYPSFKAAKLDPIVALRYE